MLASSRAGAEQLAYRIGLGVPISSPDFPTGEAQGWDSRASWERGQAQQGPLEGQGSWALGPSPGALSTHEPWSFHCIHSLQIQS